VCYCLEDSPRDCHVERSETSLVIHRVAQDGILERVDMFRWLNKQGVLSESGFTVQFTGRFTCEYREAGKAIEIEVESGLIGDTPTISIKKNAFSKWSPARAFYETPVDEQARLMKNLISALEFQGLRVEIY
jgi:hypothetical protein